MGDMNKPGNMHIKPLCIEESKTSPLIFLTWFQSVIGFIGDGQWNYIYIAIFFLYRGCAQCLILDKITGNYCVYEDSNETSK